MSKLTTDEVLAERDSVRSKIEVAITADPHVLGALFIGSVAEGKSDEFSDLDYYLYTDSFPWSRAKLVAWFSANNMNINIDYWNRTHKHHLFVEGTRVDIAVWHERQRHDIVRWPYLDFDEHNILKDDKVETILHAIQKHGPNAGPDLTNDYEGYMFSLLDNARELSRPTPNLERLVHGQVELTSHMARVMRNLPFGSGNWARPLKGAYEALSEKELRELFRTLAPIRSTEYKEFILERLEILINECKDRVIVGRAEWYRDKLKWIHNPPIKRAILGINLGAIIRESVTMLRSYDVQFEPS